MGGESGESPIKRGMQGQIAALDHPDPTTDNDDLFDNDDSMQLRDRAMKSHRALHANIVRLSKYRNAPLWPVLWLDWRHDP